MVQKLHMWILSWIFGSFFIKWCSAMCSCWVFMIFLLAFPGSSIPKNSSETIFKMPYLQWVSRTWRYWGWIGRHWFNTCKTVLFFCNQIYLVLSSMKFEGIARLPNKVQESTLLVTKRKRVVDKMKIYIKHQICWTYYRGGVSYDMALLSRLQKRGRLTLKNITYLH